MSTDGKCSCPCHKFIGILIVLFGLTLLLGALNLITPMLVGIICPTLIIIGGLKLIFSNVCKCCNSSGCTPSK